MGQKRLLIINAGWEQEDLLQAAKDAGCYVIATNATPNAPAFHWADETYVLDPRNIDGHLKLAQEKQVNGVMADQCDYSHYAAAYIAERLGLPGSGLRAVQNATNKKWMRQTCEQAGIQQPRFFPCKYLEEAQAAAERLGYPVMVKPLDNRGNFGANQVENAGQLADAFYEAIAHAHSRECLVEKFIVGTMHTVDGFVFSDGTHQATAVASKVMLGGRKRVAMEIRYTPPIPEELIQRLKENHIAVTKALGLKLGCSHGEYMVTNEGEIYLVECANRGGGVYISSRIVPAVSGYDISMMLVQLALGEAVLPKTPEENKVLMRFLQLEPGQIAAIENVETIRKMPGILTFKLTVGAGDQVQSITCDAGRHGFIIATGQTHEEVTALAEKARQTLSVQYEVPTHA